MSLGSPQTACRNLQSSWFNGDYARCTAILTEAFPAEDASKPDPQALGAFAAALRPLTSRHPAAAADPSFEALQERRTDLLRKAAATDNSVRIALESGAVATLNDGPAWSVALFNYVKFRNQLIGSRRERLWEDVAFIHWAIGRLLAHCSLDQDGLWHLLRVLLHADAHLNWEAPEASILKAVIQEGRTQLQLGFVDKLLQLAQAGAVPDAEAFIQFDADGRLLPMLIGHILKRDLRHPNSVALLYFLVQRGDLSAADFLGRVADCPYFLISDRQCLIMAGEYLHVSLGRTLRQQDDGVDRPVHLTWWLNVNFPREQLGNPGFVVSRVPFFVRAMLARGQASLYVCATGEASWFHPRWTDWMAGLVTAFACQPDQIVYLCQNTRFAEDYRAFRAETGARVRYGVIPFNSHLVVDGLRAEPVKAEPRRHFLCFNQRPAVQRAALLLNLHRDGLLEQTHLSFNQSIAAEQSISGPTLEPWMDMPAAVIDGLIADVEATLPLRLDLAGQGLVTAADGNYVYALNASLFADAAVYLVTETEMEGPAMCRFTEKTIKGLASEIPFVVFGSVGVLASLRELGFRSFSPLIDESYDSIADPVARFRAAYAEVRRLGAMPLESLVALRQLLQPVLQHNRQHLLAIDPLLHDRLTQAIEAVAGEG